MFKFSSVTDLIIAINDVLENTLESISFEGEISQIQFSSVGHIYFTVKDEEIMTLASPKLTDSEILLSEVIKLKN